MHLEIKTKEKKRKCQDCTSMPVCSIYQGVHNSIRGQMAINTGTKPTEKQPKTYDDIMEALAHSCAVFQFD